MVVPLAAQAPTLSVAGTLVATASGVTQQFGPAALPPAGSFAASSDVVLTIAPAAMGTAVLVVRWQATAGGGTASVSIDVGNDVSNEWSEAVSLFRPSADLTGGRAERCAIDRVGGDARGVIRRRAATRL